MSRALTILCITAAAGIGGSTWVLLGAGATEHLDVPKSPRPVAAPQGEPGNTIGDELRAARATCRVDAMDAVITRMQAACRASPDTAAAWHALAEGHLERSLLRSHDRGMVVGAPTFSQLPPDVQADVDAGLVAAKRARELGDDSGDLFRIEAGLMSQRIVGIGSAMQWNGKIQEALNAAGAREQHNPQLHVALGLRKLMAPTLLGHDPEKALVHFEFAAASLERDERAAVFAGMASFLQKKRQQAIAWLERAVARNPNSRFARVVLARLRAGEDDPFGRDITAAEAAATK